MNPVFKPGMKLKCVVVNQDEFYQLGPNGHQAKCMTVTIENGQMAGVPWALVELNNGRKIMCNLALSETIELLEQEEPDV